MPKCQLLFSAVFGFRNPSNEIFSESDEINAQVPIFTGSIQNTREPNRGGAQAHQTLGRRGQGGARATLLCRRLVSPPTPPLRLYKGP